MANFLTIGEAVPSYGDLSIFAAWPPPSAILDSSGVCWDYQLRIFGGLYCFAKFGLNRCSSFNNMRVLIFCAFGLQ